MSKPDPLHRAATLMRQRATEATPRPWHVTADGHGRDKIHWIGSSAGLVATGVREGDDEIAMVELDQRDADYIASMHPLVAFAVADFLDSWGGINPPQDAPYAEDWRHAMAIARAYLGEGE